ncbi:CDP-glycerol glycerophosphotransferase [Kribbella aluminosa]|uniref:CDP-glycerol glycerophosphotransferase n=1 Tax=Kribbella aluminosa TaxID=416017 RepID=A0ABS4URU0_9ACTN|nr:glycosyltransferase [Kribbella aluminosa]MBP2354365.1 CDP-glycerol glycerophosphotransferase [Kribbella aluminosa]
MTPRLSVVVPFYGVGEYLGDCLESIARQAWSDFEAILVDDGSPDDSAVIAKEFCARDERFRLIQQDNAGPGPARDAGIREATGEYLAFVDGDDLVSRYGFAALVRTLDSTGSDFAGGNARRFNNSFGVRPSWLHKQPFARVRHATHVTEFPDLVLDRMLWNKVYRRSFWTENGYTFPPIRYEDYPVALKAHLDAVTVDTITQAVYYWRERESGESITQQKFQLGNIRDRVTSAGMVLDLVENAVPVVRRRVHAHLAQIDVLTLMSAFGSVPAGDEQVLVDLSRALLDRLDEDVLAKTHRYDRIQHAALRSGDVDLLRRLADFRNSGGLRGGARAVSRGRRLDYNYPGLGESVVPRRLYGVRDQDLSLATSVREVAWVDGTLSIKGTAEIRHLETDRTSTLEIALAVGETSYPLPVRRYAALDLHGTKTLVGFEVLLDQEVLGECTGAPAHFDVRMRSGRRVRKGMLGGQGPGSPGWPPGAWIDDTNWIQPGPGKSGWFSLRRLTDPCRLTAAEQVGDELVLHGRASFDEPELYLSRPVVGGEEEVPLEVDGRDFTARLPIRDIVDAANHDDPFGRRTTRVFRVRGPEEQQRVLLWTAGDTALTGVADDRVVTLTRSTGGYVNLHESPIRTTAVSAVVEGNELVVCGAGGEATFSWRRYLTDSDDHLDVVCRRTARDDGGWSVAVDVGALVPVTAVQVSVDPLAALADWILFATSADGTAHAVQCEPFLCSRLPLAITHGANGSHALAVRPHAGTLHVEVR